MSERPGRQLIQDVRALLTAKDWTAANLLLSKSLQEFPDSSFLLASACQVEMQRGALADARALIDRAISVEPNVAAYHLISGRLRQRLGDLAGAQMAFMRAAEIKPNVAAHHASLGAVADTMKQHSAAVSHYQAALKIDPLHVRWWGNLSRSARLAGDSTLAAEARTRSAVLRPGVAAVVPQREPVITKSRIRGTGAVPRSDSTNKGRAPTVRKRARKAQVGRKRRTKSGNSR